MIQLVKQNATAAQLDLIHITMHGYGHEQPAAYLDLIGAWTRGEKSRQRGIERPENCREELFTQQAEPDPQR